MERKRAFLMCARSLFRLAIIVPLLLADGCFFRERATAPPGWEAADAASTEGSATCPSITGRYAVGGDLDPTTPQELCHTSGAKFEWALDWLCDTNLVTNLISRDSAASWIEIQQPDPDTLRLIFFDASTAPVELHRSKGDFGCSATAITRVQRDVWRMATNYGVSGGEEPVAGKTIARTSAAMATLFAYGGIQTLARTFRTDTEGALVMKIVRSRHGLMLGIPVSEVYSTFVTWKRVESITEVEADPPP